MLVFAFRSMLRLITGPKRHNGPESEALREFAAAFHFVDSEKQSPVNCEKRYFERLASV